MHAPPSPPPPACWLSPAHEALIRRGVSVIVGSRDLAHRPSLMRGLGACLGDDGATVTVFLSRRQSRQLLSDIAATGRIAVVFSAPSTHETLQLKATRARLREADASDAPALARYRAAMVGELGAIGVGPDFAAAMLASELDDLVAVNFEPEQAFDQTPGPRAGAAIAPPGTPPEARP